MIKSLSAEQLVRKPRVELDALFTASQPGALPDGEGTGSVIVCAGLLWGRLCAWLTRWFLWQGHVFDAREGSVVNRISPFSIRAIRAKVRLNKSWLDGREAIVLDYSSTSFLGRNIRDEIREVAPGLYLGKVWWRKIRLNDFVVSF